jgi:hypothetical protein
VGKKYLERKDRENFLKEHGKIKFEGVVRANSTFVGITFLNGKDRENFIDCSAKSNLRGVVRANSSFVGNTFLKRKAYDNSLKKHCKIKFKRGSLHKFEFLILTSAAFSKCFPWQLYVSSLTLLLACISHCYCYAAGSG